MSTRMCSKNDNNIGEVIWQDRYDNEANTDNSR